MTFLDKVSPSRSLTADVVDRLREQITSGALPPGARLPTEQQLVAGLGVSRTVVREAVAALRADGLVVTRQGVGAFVTATAERRPFRIDPDDLASIDTLLGVMALRTGVEVEAAGLAATRRTAGQLRAMGSALDAVDAALARGEDAVQADFAFHRAIAAATRSPPFGAFLDYLGQFIIPRQSLHMEERSAPAQAAYLQRVQSEHRALLAAVEARDEAAAREAMGVHLRNSQTRYARLRSSLAG